MIYISHLLPDEEMEELLQVSGAGIESIDFSISDNLDQLPQTVREYREKMKRLGVEHVILHGPFLDVNPCAYDRLVREVTMTRFAQCCEAGRELGAERIVFHSGMNPYVYYKESWAEHVALFWQEFLEKCPDMEIVLENVFDDDWRLLLDVFRRVNRPNFRLCLDIGHAYCYSSLDVREWAAQLAPYVSHVHIHDNSGDRDAHLGLGRGSLPWREVLSVLPKNSKRSWTVECMTKEDVEICLRALK